jgi:WD repeat-containing protein 35
MKLVGLAEIAVGALLKLGDVNAALSVCVELNQWDLAMDLAQKHKMNDVKRIFVKSAEDMLRKNKAFEAVKLYRKAKFCKETADILFQSADNTTKLHSDPMSAKKLFVIAALEIERQKHFNVSGKDASEQTNMLVANLIEDNMTSRKHFNDPWRGAEAYHFYMMSQRQLHKKQFLQAFMTVRFISFLILGF